MSTPNNGNSESDGTDLSIALSKYHIEKYLNVIDEFQQKTQKTNITSGLDGSKELRFATPAAMNDFIRNISASLSSRNNDDLKNLLDWKRELECIDSNANLLANKKLHDRFRTSVEHIKEALNRFGVQNVALSFNGGKDCTVLLYLLYHALMKYFSGTSSVAKAPVLTFYNLPEDPFEQVELFCTQLAHEFILDLQKYPSAQHPANITTTTGSGKMGMRESLEQFKHDYPQISAIFLGMRRTDPFADKMGVFEKCSPGWPEYIRINPILDWDYDDIWAFLDLLPRTQSNPDLSKGRYCSLYEIGYTSVGGVNDTIPNPHLKDSQAPFGYLHARQLMKHSEERAGRLKKRRKQKSENSQ